MVLLYESDPLDDEHARGRFYHVCRGRIDQYSLECSGTGSSVRVLTVRN